MFAPVCLIFCVLLGFVDSSRSGNEGPTFTSSPTNVTAPLGMEAKLSCRVTGPTKAKYWWEKNGNRIGKSKKYRVKRFRYLKIKNVDKLDAGVYVCWASYRDRKIHQTITLEVEDPHSRNPTGDIAPYFTEKPKMKKDYLLYPAGNRLKIVCTAEGRPAPAITWLKDNKKLKYLPDGVTPLTNITFDITFNSLKPKQAGKYKCVVSNKAGLIDMTYTIKVKQMIIGKPVLQNIENRTAYEGENVTITCKTVSDGLPHFQWVIKENNAFKVIDPGLNREEYIWESDVDNERWHGVNLRLINVRQKDERAYYCIVGGDRGYMYQKFHINVEPRPVTTDDKLKLVDKTTRSLTVQAGKTAHLKCEFRTRQQEWRIVWKVNGKVIEVQKKKRFRQRDRKSSKLWIKKVVKADSGIYECIASNDHGRVRTRLNLTVVGGGEHGKGPPWFTKNLKPQFVAWPASSDLKLVCRADGEPPLKYQWLKDGKVLKYRRLDPKFNTTRWYLRINTAVPSDDGYYTCVVSNRLGNISHRIQVNVIEKGPVRPLLSALFPVNKTARIGDNVTFQFIELFSPILTDYRWFHWNKLPPSYPDLGFGDDSPSSNSSYYKLINPEHYQSFPVAKSEGKYGGRVLLTNVTKKDEGMYTCLISNHIGKSWKSAFLRVLDDGIDVPTGKPEFVPETRQAKVGENVRLKCALTDWHVSWRMIWYGNGEMIRPRMDSRFRLVIGKSSFLVINDVRKGDAGIFECVSSNAFGTVSKKFKLTVVD